MNLTRRQWLAAAAAWSVGSSCASGIATDARGIRITGLKVTPIALPDPPLLAAGGCHGPYFLRNVIEITTDAGVTWIGETHGNETVTEALEVGRARIVGHSVFAYRALAAELRRTSHAAYAGIELACLDAVGRATGRRLCELLGGPVREEVEFASYLFFRYAADHPAVLRDERVVDGRGRGPRALDPWGEVRTPAAMAEMARRFHDKFGFRIHKLKAGVLPPDVELEALRAIGDAFGGRHLLRIDPNARWTEATAVRIGRKLRELPLEYYEDPVAGQDAMAVVRQKTELPMSTNMCVTRLEHIPDAVVKKPIDVVLGDHHGWGGITIFQSLGELCDVLGWKLSQHSNNHGGITMAAMIQVGAVVPQLTVASDTHYVWLPDESDILIGPKLPIRAGRMAVPRGPGLGVELDRDKLARAHETFRKCGMRVRDDAATMRRFEPQWERKLF